MRAGEAARCAGRTRAAARRSSAPSTSCRWCRRRGRRVARAAASRAGRPARGCGQRRLESALRPARQQRPLDLGQPCIRSPVLLIRLWTGHAGCSRSSYDREQRRGRPSGSRPRTSRRPRPGRPAAACARTREADARRARGHVDRRSGTAEGTYAFDRLAQHPPSRSTRSTPRRRRSAGRCTSATSSPTPTPTSSPATSGCAAATSSTRWAGTTTACRPSAGCRTTTASAATRRCPTTRLRAARRSRTRSDQVPISRRNFVELCKRLTEEDEQAFEKLWRRVGLSVDWSNVYPTISEASRDRRRSGCSCTTWPAARPTRRRRRPSGTSPSGPRSPRPSSRTGSAPAPTTGSRSTAPTAPVYIETTRPELLPACVALVAHPDDERYQPLFGTTVRTPLFDVEVPVVAHHLAEPDKGSGIAMICTFGDLTDVHLVARAAAADPGDRRLGRPDPAARPRLARHGRPRRRTPSSPARHVLSARSGSWSCCASPATSTASRRRSPTR